LDEQLAAMDENERIARSLSDKCGCHNRLAESGRRCEHAMVMRRQCLQCGDLSAVQRSPKSRPVWQSIVNRTEVIYHDLSALSSDQLNGFLKTPPR
jgi:hypothetical protein